MYHGSWNSCPCLFFDSLLHMLHVPNRDIFCAGRVPEEDLRRTMKACGGSIQTSVNNLTSDVLGKCEIFQEEQIGGERCVCVHVYACVHCFYHTHAHTCAHICTCICTHVHTHTHIHTHTCHPHTHTPTHTTHHTYHTYTRTHTSFYLTLNCSTCYQPCSNPLPHPSPSLLHSLTECSGGMAAGGGPVSVDARSPPLLHSLPLHSLSAAPCV